MTKYPLPHDISFCTQQFLPLVNPLKIEFLTGKRTYLRLNPFLPLIGLMWKIRVCNVNLFSDLLSKSDREHIAYIAQRAHILHRAPRTSHFAQSQSLTYRILHKEHKEHFTLHNVKVTHIEYCTYCPKNIALCTMSKSPYRILHTEYKEYCTLHLAQRQSHTKNSPVDRFAVKEGL